MVRMTRWAMRLAPGVLIGLNAIAAAGASFEGSVTQRSLIIPKQAVQKQLAGDAPASPAAVFAIPADTFIALARDPSSGVRQLDAVIHVKGSKFRVDLKINGKPGYMVVESAEDRTMLVVPGDRVYVEWTRADREALGKELAQRERTLREQLATAPADQRKQLEAQLPPTPGPTPAVRKLDRAETVNGFKATAHEMRGGSETTMGWVSAEYPGLLTAFRAAAKSQQGPRPSTPTPVERLADYGLPVRVQTLDDAHYQIIDIVRIHEEPVPDEVFTVPAGFTKSALQGAPGAAQSKAAPTSAAP